MRGQHIVPEPGHEGGNHGGVLNRNIKFLENPVVRETNGRTGVPGAKPAVAVGPEANYQFFFGTAFQFPWHTAQFGNQRNANV